ncbi:MAG: hypothetical protein HYX78_05735 [Armatimonadetes bacterium]|nr:hypothetical protein [Armatimonadota bacterium]
MNYKVSVFVSIMAVLIAAQLSADPAKRIFPDSLPERQWVTLPAEGFTVPVTGVIYRGGNMLPGMPLGSLGTGFISFGTDGTLDYVTTMFNEFQIRGGGGPQQRSSVPTHRLPFLGLSVGGKTTLLSLKQIEGVKKAGEISYWGHYPVADVQYETDTPVQVDLRAWTPFFPGDSVGSNTPGTVFEFRLHNESEHSQQATLAFSFSRPLSARQTPRYSSTAIDGRPGAPFMFGEPEFKLDTLAPVEEVFRKDPVVTVFFLGIVNRVAGAEVNPVVWGSTGTGQELAILVDSDKDRLGWATNRGRVMTLDGAFKDYYYKPVIICVRKTPGPINSTTSIWINGEKQQLSLDGSSAVPDIAANAVFLGGGASGRGLTPSMVAGQTIIYTRGLMDVEQEAVGSYLANTYGLKTAYSQRESATTPDKISGLFSWFRADSHPGIKDGEAVALERGLTNVERRAERGSFTGVVVKGKQDGLEIGYALGVMGRDGRARFGGPLGENAALWNKISSSLPEPASGEFGSSVSVDISLKPGEDKTLRFLLAWHAPVWRSNYGNPYINTYSARFKSASDLAEYLSREHEALLERILSWQQVIYSENRFPNWLQDALINVLAILPQESFWMKSSDPSHWWGDKGFFCVNESLQSCPQMACLGNDQFGEWPVNLLFPELGLRKLEAFKHYQRKDIGQTGSTLGAGTDPDRLWFNQQLAIDGQVYIHAVDRYRLSTGDDKVLDEWYPSVRDGLKFMFTQDTDGDGLIDVHGRGHYLDAWPMEGVAMHVATYWLATLEIVERMARMQSDDVFAQTCRTWRERGMRSLERKMWNESVGSYLLYYDETTGKKWDSVVCDQLAGDMYAYLHSLPRILAPDRVERILSTLERLNVAATPFGIRLACRPDGSEDRACGYSTSIIPSYSTMAVAIAMLRSSNTHFRKLGTEIVRRTWHDMLMLQNMAWDMPCMLNVDGTRSWGLEYYHNTMLWVLPLAILGEDVRASCAPGGFANKVRMAGSKRSSLGKGDQNL